ncbi:MAG: sugar phosphate isomerase/epimerase family protein [Methanocorpusculum sp.]|nr:sugar phosphate isomerase/epimerase family protein [Methanocorpusculum sp.]
MTRHFSISTHCLSAVPLSDALAALAPHTSCVEIMNDGRHYIQSSELLQSYSFAYSIHAPARGVNIASVLEPMRCAAVEIICDSIELAAEVNAQTVVFHPGYFAFTEEYERAVSALKMSLAAIASYAEDAGVSCCVENMGNWGYFFLKCPDDFALTGETPFCLDVGHANEVGTLSAFLDVPFVHVHLHDNDGTTDSHEAVGCGTIDFARVMRAVRANHIACPVVEVGTLDGCLASIEALSGCL